MWFSFRFYWRWLFIIAICWTVLVFLANLLGTYLTEGHQLVVSLPTGQTQTHDLFLVDIDRGLAQNITYDAMQVDNPIWSPDGTQLLFVSDRNSDCVDCEMTSRLYLMDADGGNVRAIPIPNANHIASAWSPDGTQIAYVTVQSDAGKLATKIFLIDPISMQSRVLASDWRGRIREMRWSLDGDRIYVLMAQSDIVRVFAQGIDSKEPEVRLEFQSDQKIGSANNPLLSPNGDSFIATLFNPFLDNNYEVYVYDTEKDHLRNITDHVATDYRAVWSPDGTRIAFVSDRNGSFNLYTMFSNSDVIDQVTYSNENVRDAPIWSPDGRYLIFSREVDTGINVELCITRVDQSGVRCLLSVGQSWSAAWRP